MSRGRVLLLGGLVAAGVLLRFAVMGGDGLWLDEGYTAWRAHLPRAEYGAVRANDDAPPLYYALQRLILPHLPPREASVRFLSAAAGAATLVWLAACPPVPAAAAATVAFFAFGTYGTYYGRQGRSYGLLLLWEAVLLTATARALAGRRRWLPVLALAEGLALWTHNAAAPLAVGANVAWLASGRRDPVRWFAAQAGALLIWLPYLVHAAPQFAIHTLTNTWIASFWRTVPLALGPLLSLGAFTSGARVWPPPPTDRWAYLGPGSALVAILALGATAVLLVAAFRARPRGPAVLAASMTLGPLVALDAASFVTQPGYVLARTDAIAYLGFVLWCAMGFVRLPRAGRWAAGGALALSTVLATAASLPIGPRAQGNDRDIGLHLRAQVRPGDWVVFVGLSRPSIDYYLSGGRPGRPDPAIRRLHYPAIFSANPAAPFPEPADSVRAWEREALALRDRFEREADPTGTLWYVGPIRPSAPRDPTASDLPYPGSMLAYELNGLKPLDAIERRAGDRVQVDWIVFGVRRDRLIPREELKSIQEAP